MTLHDLLDKRTVSGDGRALGRIFDFKGRREDGDLLITHIHVGWPCWVETLWPHSFVRRLLTRREPLEIPWEAIESVGREVRLARDWTYARARRATPPRRDS
jgi:hypothetical protein